MANLSISRCRPVEVHVQHTGPAGVALDPGEYAYPDATTGKWAKGDASAAATAVTGGIVITDAGAAEACTIVQKGLLDVGGALSALDFGDPVYLSNDAGLLADAAGDESKQVGIVWPGWSHTTADKLLLVDIS